MHYVLPGMVERDRGRVICVSAIASRLVAPNLSAYCTGKIAQNRLVAEAAAELAATKVAVFAIDAGGKLKPTGTPIEVPSPSCVMVLE